MTINKKIDLLVEYKNKGMTINPFTGLGLLDALHATLDASLALLKLIEEKGEQDEKGNHILER